MHASIQLSKRPLILQGNPVRVKRVCLIICAPLVVMLAVACAMGTNVVRPTPEELTLGATTKEAAIARYGSPDTTGETEVNGHKLDIVAYTYVDTRSGRSHVPGVNAARTLALHFANGKLVGYIYTSSFHEDHTDFDASRVDEIREGESTKSEVNALLGQPNGEMIYPMIDKSSNTRFVYRYSYVDIDVGFLTAKGKVYQKQLAIDFDATGTVTNVEYVLEETKM